ncbi:hypothetical protein KAU43_04275 [candidate division WOR-3 bacterium]|nr:hypothetical protein [candidate division WOR-3 bacterium]
MTEHIKKAILECIKNNDGKMDRVDVVSHMGLPASTIYSLINELIKEDKIEMKMNPTSVEAGKHRLYVIEPNHEKAVEFLTNEAEFRLKVLSLIDQINRNDKPCTIKKALWFLSLSEEQLMVTIKNLQEGGSIIIVDSEWQLTEVGHKALKTFTHKDRCPVCQTEMEWTGVDGSIGLRCPHDCDPDMQPFYHHDECGKKFATAKEYANHECFQKIWKNSNHEYGSVGKPIFICSKKFDKPINEKYPEISEPCGFHQADIWCIINGNVCPHLIFGLEPIIEDPKPESICVIDFIQKAVDQGYTKEQFMEYMGAWWQDYLNGKEQQDQESS